MLELRPTGIINDDASSLPADLLERYCELLRDGSPGALAQALAIHRNARRDAERVRHCLERAARLKEQLARRPEAEARLEELRDRAESLDRRIAELNEQREAVAAQILQTEHNEAGALHPNNARHSLSLAADTMIVRKACETELREAGIL